MLHVSNISANLVFVIALLVTTVVYLSFDAPGWLCFYIEDKAKGKLFSYGQSENGLTLIQFLGSPSLLIKSVLLPLSVMESLLPYGIHNFDTQLLPYCTFFQHFNCQLLAHY